MKNLLKVRLLVIFSLLITISACRHVYYDPSKSLIVSRSFDVQLKDSAMIYGNVYYVGNQKTPIPQAHIWIENSSIKTLSDLAGYFSLKVLPGKYTIKCFRDDPNEEFTVVLKDLSILPNEKVEVNLLRGTRAE